MFNNKLQWSDAAISQKLHHKYMQFCHFSVTVGVVNWV